MTKAEVFEKVKAIVADQLGVLEEDVTRDSSFGNDLWADSLDLIELLMAAEEEFGLEVPDEDAATIPSVGAAVDYICQKKGITE